MASPANDGFLSIIIIGEIILRNMDGESQILITQIFRFQGSGIIFRMTCNKNLTSFFTHQQVHTGIRGRGEDFKPGNIFNIFPVNCGMPGMGNPEFIIKAVIKKAMSPAILTGYTEIMDSLTGCFETSMPYDMIAELVRDMLDNGGSWNIVSYSVNGTGDSRRPYSMSTNAYVMIPDQETVDTAIEKIHQVMNGETVE